MSWWMFKKSLTYRILFKCFFFLRKYFNNEFFCFCESVAFTVNRESFSERCAFHWLQVFNFRRQGGEKATLWPTLFLSPSWDISCTMCLWREGVSRLPTGFHRFLWGGQQRRRRRSAWRPSPDTRSLFALFYILSCHSALHLFHSLSLFMPQGAARGNMFLMSAPPSSVPGVLFTFTNSALWPPLVISVNVHFNSIAFDLLKSLKKQLHHPKKLNVLFISF